MQFAGTEIGSRRVRRFIANCRKKMTRKSLHLFAAITAAALMFSQLAVGQTAPPIAVNVPQLNQQEFQRWVGKSNAYVQLLNDSTRAIDSLRRYASWVDMKAGPTGKER
jgi:hypothetical protein